MSLSGLFFFHIRLWLVYGMTESFCLVFLMWVQHGRAGIGQKWLTTAVLTLGVYPLVGVVCGGLHFLTAKLIQGLEKRNSKKSYTLINSAAGGAIIAGLFLFNAILRRQYYAVPGAVFALGIAFFHARGQRHGILINRLVAFFPAEATIVIMGFWAFWLQPRGTLPLWIVVGGTGFSFFGVGVSFLVFKKMRFLFFSQKDKKSLTEGKSLLFTFVLSFVFIIGLGCLFYQKSLRKELPFSSQPVHNSSRQPNVVLIIMDTVRADHMSVYGYNRPTTPFLERFIATESTLYRNSFSASNHTLPSHASIFSGLQASATGAYLDHKHIEGRPINKGIPLLTEALRDLGFSTFGNVANSAFLDEAYGFGRGFRWYDCNKIIRVFTAGRYQFFQQTIKEFASIWFESLVYGDYVNSRKINEVVPELIKKNGQRPFFLFLNYMDAHWPYLSPNRIRSRFQDVGMRFHWDAPECAFRYWPYNSSDSASVPFLRFVHNQYDASIRTLDEALEELVRCLKENSIFDNTLIVITSDHGEGLGEKSILYHHGVGVGPEMVRVPLIIKYPFQRKGKTDERFTSGVDVLPTVLDVLNVPWSHETHGRSLNLPGRDRKGRPVVVESFVLGMNKEGVYQFPNDSGLAEVLFVFDDLRFHWHLQKGIFSQSNQEGESGNDSQKAESIQIVRSYLVDMKKRMRSNRSTGIPQDQYDRLRTLGYVN
jgi:arylsulfatase A-like enzyme